MSQVTLKSKDWYAEQYLTALRPQREIAAEIGVSKATIARHLRSLGLIINRKTKNAKISKQRMGRCCGAAHPLFGKRVSDEVKDKISQTLKLKMAGAGNPMFGKHHSVESRMNMSLHSERRQRGAGHHNWKGGKKRMREYILRFCPDHPFATSQGYVLEHRLVMEADLGRYLRPEEVVHHINGDPSDNRKENLSLFESQSCHRLLHLRMEQCHA